MTDRSLPEPTRVPWQDKPIVARDVRRARQSGLAAFLDRVRQHPCATGLETLECYSGLVLAAGFALVPGDAMHLEGWFSAYDEECTTRFRVALTARTAAEQRAVLADLQERLLDR